MDEKWFFDGVEFKKGDRVRVMGFAEDWQDGAMGRDKNERLIPWNNIWVPSMDKCIGHYFEINSIDSRGAYFVDIEGETLNKEGFGWPLSVLQKATIH